MLLSVAKAVGQVQAMDHVGHIAGHRDDLADRLPAVVRAHPPTRVQLYRAQVRSVPVELASVPRQIPASPAMLGRPGKPLPERWVPLDEQVEHLPERVDGIEGGVKLVPEREANLSKRGCGPLLRFGLWSPE